MARTALPTLVPPKLYKHFAAVTMALTVLVALLADNQTRDEVDLIAQAKAADQSARDYARGQANRMADKAPGVGKMKVIGHGNGGFGPEPAVDSSYDSGGTLDAGAADAAYAGSMSPTIASANGALPAVIPQGMARGSPGRNTGRIATPKRLSGSEVARLMAISAGQTGGSDHGADLAP